MPMTAIFRLGPASPLASYSPGVRADNVVYVSGVLPLDKDTNLVHPGDAAAQTRHVLESIKAVIEAARATMEDVAYNAISSPISRITPR